jgi:anti-sigma B factor antagonist
MQLEFKTHSAALIIQVLIKRLDALAAPTFRNSVLEKKEQNAHLIFEMHRVEFMDSSGIVALIGIYKSLPSSGSIRLVAANQALLLVLKMTHLSKLFPNYETLQDALNSLSENQLSKNEYEN